jgi:hypothetical protein
MNACKKLDLWGLDGVGDTPLVLISIPNGSEFQVRIEKKLH